MTGQELHTNADFFAAPSRRHPVIQLMSRHAMGLFKASLYLGLTYLVLVAGVEPCQGQGCWGGYYERAWHCDRPLPAHKEYCSSALSNCADCPTVPGCAAYGTWYTIVGCTWVPYTCPDSLTAGATVNCSMGGGGWCNGSASLALGATDSAGHAVSFTGSINGGGFSCGNPCTQNLPEGNGSYTWTASCSGGMTQSGSGTYKLDSTPPVVSYGLSGGVPGAGGWYLSGPVTMNCVGSDALSGFQGISYGQQTAGGDGVSTLSCTVSDVAGNTATASATVSIDGTAPAVTGAVSGGIPGGGGWYLSGPVSLVCSATDATSGVSGVSYGAMNATATGTTNLNCTAFDNAGNSSSYSTSISIDNIPPGGDFRYAGSYCSGGWYNTPVRVSLQAGDGESGPAGSAFQLNGVEGSSNQEVGEGVYTVTGTVWDVAGNSAAVSDTLRVDTTPPATVWKTADGTWIGGTAVLQGSSTDFTSGIAAVEISVDGGRTWVEIGKNEVWSFEWNTLDPDAPVPDGDYELLARAKDNACNQEHTGRVTIRVDNTPPELKLKDSINLMGRNTTVIAVDAGSGVDHGTATISGNGIEPRQIPFAGGETQIAWDGRTGDGKTAPFGIYKIVVEVWDAVGNYSEAEGKWLRPAPEKPTGIPQNPDSNAHNPPNALNGGRDAGKNGLATKGLPFWSLALPIGALGVWLAASNVALARDKRWSELRGIRHSVARYLDQKQTNFPEEEGEE